MSELIPITLAAVVLALLSHKTSEYDPLRCRYGRQDRLWFGIMAVLMILFVGLRIRYNDTENYTSAYKTMEIPESLFAQMRWELGDNPLFTVCNRILRKLSFSVQSFLLFYTTVTLGLNLWFLRKYASNVPMAIFLFFAVGMFTFSMAAIKQCVAMAICLIAIDRVIRGKYISFVLWVLLAAGFHPYALMYLIVPALMFRPWSLMTVVMLAVFAAAGVIMERLIGTIVDVTDLLGENFDAAAFSGEGVNPFRVAVVAVPILVSFFTRTEIARKHDRVQNLMVNLAMLNAEIMFVGLFGTANYFARLANYFLPFQALAMPWLLSHFEPQSCRLMTWSAVGGYGAYYLFSNAIMDNFDAHFISTTLWKYLRSLF